MHLIVHAYTNKNEPVFENRIDGFGVTASCPDLFIFGEFIRTTSDAWRAGYPASYDDATTRFQLSHTSPDRKKNRGLIGCLKSPYGVRIYS